MSFYSVKWRQMDMMLNRSEFCFPVYCAGRVDAELNNPAIRICFYQTKKRESDPFYETVRDRNERVSGIVEDLNIIERL